MHRNHTEIFDQVATFHDQFFSLRAGKIAEINGEMLRSIQAMKRRLREGAEFVRPCASAMAEGGPFCR